MVPRLGPWSTNCPSHPVHSSRPRARSLRPKTRLDAGVAWHYGDPLGEQRSAERPRRSSTARTGSCSRISGAERLTWLHTISSQHIAALPDGASAENLSLDVNGRVEHHFVQTDLDGVTWIDTEADRGPDLLAFLQKMVFWSKAEPRDGNELAVLSLLGPDAATVLDARSASPAPAEPTTPSRCPAAGSSAACRGRPPTPSTC